ncbi:MAG: putative sugar nucleotidyl transferase, partial [Planctomycetaceae bacterium]
ILFEDAAWPRFLPLVYTRAVFQLLCGMDALWRKAAWLAERPSGGSRENGHAACTTPLELWCRPEIADVVAEHTGRAVNRSLPPQQDRSILLLNGRGIWTRLPEWPHEDEAWVGTAGPDHDIACLAADAELAAQLSPDVLLDGGRARSLLASLPRRDVSGDVQLVQWPWQLIHANERAIQADWSRRTCGPPAIEGRIDRGSYLLDESAIHIEAGARIKPCVVIDAEQGPVWIGRDVTVLPHCYIQGPAYLGDGCLLQPGAVVHAGSTIGPRCKVGGEIEASIIQGHSNKQHDGFLGHSYIGSWVNIAADCINSDLKNTYGTVRVPINGRSVESGEMFVGLIVGDHTKTGVNVSFPTGAVVGMCSSVLTSPSPKFVPSFAWLDGRTVQRFDVERGLSTARKVMSRRQRAMTPADERAFRQAAQWARRLEDASALFPAERADRPIPHIARISGRGHRD